MAALLAAVCPPAVGSTASGGGAAPGEATAGARSEAWREDLREFAAQLPERHADAFRFTPRERFEAAVAELDGRIPSLADHEVVVGLMRLAALLGDGHTTIDTSTLSAPPRRLPLKFYWFRDGITVIAASAERSHLLGARLLRVGGAPVEEAAERLGEVFARENGATFLHRVPDLLTNTDVLHAQGLIESPERAAFTFRTLEGVEVVEEALALAPGEKPTTRAWRESSPGPTPLYLSDLRTAYWLREVPEDRLLYIQYNRCVQNPARPFADFAAEALRIVDGGGVDTVVVDLRWNGGGDSSIAQPLIRGLRSRDRVNRPGGLFVIVGRGTFSSAYFNAQDFRDRTSAIIVGEPTGQRPNAFGEIKSFTLPRSGLRVWYSTKFWRRDAKRDLESMLPDIEAPLTAADYFSGRDPALEACLERARSAP